MKMFKLRIVLTLLSLGSVSFSGIAQQDVQYSMYMFNPLSVNPAYAGTRGAFSIVGIYRSQWVGIDGSPKTANVSLHSPILNSNVSAGLSFVSDEIGLTKTSTLKADLAYKVKLNKKGHYLSMGVKTGVDFYNIKTAQGTIIDNTDQLYSNIKSKPLFNVGAGLYYYGKRHYLGLSSPKLIENLYSSKSAGDFKQIKHYYLTGGIVIPINSTIQFKPSFVAKALENAPVSVDVNASFLFYEKIWLGAMYRIQEGCGLNLVYYVNDYLSLGYSYDYALTKLRKYNSGTHEIMFGIDLRKKDKAFLTPRYF